MAPPGARASGLGCLVTTQHQAKPGSADIVPFNHYLSMLHLKKKKKKKRLNSTNCAKSLRVTVNRSVSRETVCSGSTRPVTVFTPCVVINSMLFALQTSPSNDKLRGSHALSRQRVSRPASPWWLLTSPSSPELCPPSPLSNTSTAGDSDNHNREDGHVRSAPRATPACRGHRALHLFRSVPCPF